MANDAKTTKIFAHRGFSGLYPENTMLAFRKALEIGADGIELDVQLSADGEVMVIHDENLKRVSGRGGNVKDLTRDQLQKIDVCGGHPHSLGFQGVPTLKEYFEFVKETDLITNIELKNSRVPYQGMEEKVIGLVRAYGLTSRVLFSSFNHDSMVKMKELSPDSLCAFLTDAHLFRAGAYAKRAGVDGVNPHYSYLTDRTIGEMHEKAIAVQAWTVDDEQVMRYLIKRNIYAVITNRPDVAIEVRKALLA